MSIPPEVPIPISFIAGHYFLFSADAITYLRREHNISGVLSGTLPQIPQQNVFLGLPLELMPEEARLLVERKVAYIIDDAQVHLQGMKTLADEDRRRYLYSLEQEGHQAALVQASKKEQLKQKALKQNRKSKSKGSTDAPTADETRHDDGEQFLFDSVDHGTNEPASPKTSIGTQSAFGITPADSLALLPHLPPFDEGKMPQVPSSYPLYAHLHSKGYFLSPGLRFGCQYMAYPGDPLRFHSHFLVTATGWEEEIDLMDLVAGGRLGTGVKKGYLIGGEIPLEEREEGERERTVRTFSLEWAGM